MSNLQDRRSAPRPQSGMHPGWACFMAALGAGFFLGLGLAATAVAASRGDPYGMSLALFTAAVILFIVGARKAEKLWDRP